MKIYTKAGDEGQTGLYGGFNVSKDHHLIHLTASLDELNSYLGLVASMLEHNPAFSQAHEQVQTIQNDIFNISADITKTLSLQEDMHFSGYQTENLETWIDEFEKQLPALRNFILPGGALPAAHTQVARSLCRKSERELVSLINEKQTLPRNTSAILMFLNRLSDYLFTLARFLNVSLGHEEPKALFS